MMTHVFEKLFTPGRIGTLDIPNRIVKAPTSTGMSHLDGSVSDRLFRHYQNIARGGMGLLIVEYAYVDEIASKSAHCQLGISTDEHIAGLAWLAGMIKDEGVRAAIQLEHCGRQKFLGTPPIKAASAVPWPSLKAQKGDAAIPDVLSTDEIKTIVSAYGDAARRAVMAGFDLVEIHGAHGYLITNFLSPHTNKRTDEYGGSLENRMRLLVEIVKDTRAKIGPDFPLTVRLSGSDYEPDGFEIDETVEVAKVLEDLGIDALHMSGGDHHQMIHQVTPMAIPRANNVYAAEAVKQVVDIPVIASGSITLPDLAEQILAEGRGDFIGLARPLWADPEWPRKAREGRLDDIRPCIRCNDGCLDRTFFNYQSVGCSVNPQIGREGEMDITPAEAKKTIAVVGGGVAGMEAARVARLRGHDVTLFEKRKLGGVLLEGSVAEFKADLRYLRNNMVHQIKSAGVRIVMEQADRDRLAGGGFDVVILATGGAPSTPDIPGIRGERVLDAIDIFNNPDQVGDKVVVLGGGETAVEAALYLADQGREVTLLHRRELMARDCVITDKIVYLELLAKKEVAVMLPYQVTAIDGAVLTARHRESGETITLEADHFVTALGYSPAQTGLAEALRDQPGLDLYEIGDGVRTAKVFDAIHAGYKLARRL
jgi:2,4-dienoyl-CoA reductase-like NADH-dependent reductase (Old Yellow Enzyme family)/thioredoxin reductase